MNKTQSQDELLETLDAISLLSKCLANKLKQKTKEDDKKEESENE